MGKRRDVIIDRYFQVNFFYIVVNGYINGIVYSRQKKNVYKSRNNNMLYR